MDNDLISRQAAIDALDALCDRECEYSKQQRSFMCGACRLGSAFDVIDELPSAQPEREKGKWINRSLNILYPAWERYTCSVCGKHSDNYDYCPNCGAEMERRTDE